MSGNWHSFQCLGHYFLFDVITNSLFEIDESFHNYLQGYPVPEAKLADITADIAELKANGYLQEQNEEIPDYQRDNSIKALCLHVSHDCNLRCKYCFAGTGPFGGKRENMSVEVGKAAIDFLLANSGNKRQLEIDFFGGEPLLNWDVVRQLVDYGSVTATQYGKELHFTLTTNGIALTEPIIDYLNGKEISVVLSLDGRADVNNRMRGTGCYETIVPKYQELVARRNNQNYYLRGTFTAANLDFLEDVKHLHSLGFKEISLEPVVTNDGEYRITEAMLPAIREEYERLAAYYLEQRQKDNAFTFFHFEINLNHGPCLLKRLTGCGAGYDYFAVHPNGNLYPCHQFVGVEAMLMGDVFGGIKKQELRTEFGDATLYKKENCAGCWSRFYCSGGCHANAYLSNGSIYQPESISCELQRKRLECALALKALSE
ncbi:MAG TPA: thioether cross-link-forming SCIFF peptide maturase [Bacillota bacterium]|nr:thioether cross-link-forming SCIFF peptide maturase [Bacillota bacterium]HOL10179.1 thioether cross-link-forming SCIFF peptide maturase [Bacillota bacterium]HPO97931.1 thioether cross-link-forming SCIFF peptide maturase [Bacillota bacterium]